MQTGTKGSRGRDPRRRLLALAVLLVLSLSLAAALALQAISASRRHRLTAERTLRDYAGFAAFILASRTYRDLGGAVVGSFTGWNAARHPEPLPEGTACPGGNPSFERPPRRPLRATGGTRLDSVQATFLADTLRHAMDLLREVGWRFRFVRDPGGPVDGWFITSYEVAGGWGLRGFAACLGGPDSPIRQAMLRERVLPPTLAGDLAADSLFAVSATAGSRPLYLSPVGPAASPYQGSARLGSEFGDLTLHLALRPDAAGRLVIGGLPSSPTPLAVALLGLSTLLVVAALFQLRREYELIAIRSEFVSNVSHELRTPLSQILIFTELLKLGRLRSEAERQRSLDIIEKEARRLIRLVENVLQFSRAGRARRPVELEPLPLAEVVDETVEAFRPLALAKGVSLSTDVPAGAAVRADRSAVRQILLNLLDNAVKYGPRGQTVSVAAQVRNGRTRLVVDDQGPGIPMEDRERIWQGYYRLRREARSAVAGSGIGLAVVQSLVSDLDGSAWVEDTDTGGARFIVELATATGGHS